MVSTISDIDNLKIADATQANIGGSSKDDLLFMSSLGGGIAQGGAGDDIIFGGAGNDTLRGDEGSDLLYGGAGNDLLNGGSGDDILIGGAGNDDLRGGTGNDILSGGDGSDKFFLDANSGHDTITDFSFNDGDVLTFAIGTLSGMANKQLSIASQDDLNNFLSRDGVTWHMDGDNLVIDYGAGNSLTLQNYGNPTGNNINGNSQANTLFGDSHGNLINAGAGNDAVFAGAGATKIVGGEGDDLVNGGAGNDVLGGQGGKDIIFGGAGDDQISGGAGDDILTGGSGNDTFNFKLGDGHDTITDFSAGDKINLYNDYISGKEVVTITSVDDMHKLVDTGHATADTQGDSVTLHFANGDSIRFTGLEWDSHTPL